jgi:hypothetical protein
MWRASGWKSRSHPAKAWFSVSRSSPVCSNMRRQASATCGSRVAPQQAAAGAVDVRGVVHVAGAGIAREPAQQSYCHAGAVHAVGVLLGEAVVGHRVHEGVQLVGGGAAGEGRTEYRQALLEPRGGQRAQVRVPLRAKLGERRVGPGEEGREDGGGHVLGGDVRGDAGPNRRPARA